MNQKGFIPILVLLVIAIISVGTFYLGKNSNRLSNLDSKTQPTLSNPSPVISTLSSAPDIDKWVKYKIKTLNIEFKFPENLSSKYGSLVEKEINGKRGTQLKINFSKEPNKIIIYAPSLEYTPLTYAKVSYERGIMLVPPQDRFIGFKEDSGIYFGILPYNKPLELPQEGVTQYRYSGHDILKIKSLPMRRIGPYLENPNDLPKMRAIIVMGNEIYPALTIEALLNDDLTESLFEQILATFNYVN